MSLTIGITWARGTGSTLPGKNKYPILGKPLIHYPLTALKASGTVDQHYVFTEDDEIAETVLATGWKVIPRPSHLVHYHNKRFNNEEAWKLIVEHVQQDLDLPLPQLSNRNWGSTFRFLSDYSFSLNCNTCMLRSKTFQKMFNIMKNKERPIVVPAIQCDEQLMLAHHDEYLFPLWHAPNLNRQYYPKIYKPLLSTFFQNPHITNPTKPMLYFHEISEIEAMDVHTEQDIERIEYYLQRHPDYFG